MIPILSGNVASATAGGYEVANSCRFNSGDSAKMSKTPGGDGNMRTWTYSGWIKLGNLGNWGGLIFAGIAGSTDNLTDIYFFTDNKLYIRDIVSNGVLEAYISPNRLFRDTSAWYHIVVAFDTTQGTASNRIKLYINGVQETSLSDSTYPSENYQTNINDASYAQQIGISKSTGGSDYYFDGYMAEVVLIDGQALTPSSFGEFDEDSPTIWKPKDVSGLTFGTNGFYLDFEDSSNLGNDANGGTDFTESNLAATDQATDTPTNNFATWNPLAYTGKTAMEEGNLKGYGDNNDTHNDGGIATIGVSAGKWYWENKITAVGGGSAVGIFPNTTSVREGVDMFAATNSIYYKHNGNKQVSNTNSTYDNSYTTNDIIGVALDLTNNKLYFSKNGTWQNSGDPTSGATGTGALSVTSISPDFYFPVQAGYTNSHITANFGSPPYTITSGNADGNGYGNFEYAVPNSYYSLCSKNLAEFG